MKCRSGFCSDDILREFRDPCGGRQQRHQCRGSCVAVTAGARMVWHSAAHPESVLPCEALLHNVRDCHDIREARPGIPRSHALEMVRRCMDAPRIAPPRYARCTSLTGYRPDQLPKCQESRQLL